VFDVVREQITRVLQYQLTQLDQLRNKLRHLAYQDITNLWQAERVAKEHDELTATPIQSAAATFQFLASSLAELIFLNYGCPSYSTRHTPFCRCSSEQSRG